jgi:D-alanyl-D-alanine carboxypeptidase
MTKNIIGTVVVSVGMAGIGFSLGAVVFGERGLRLVPLSARASIGSTQQYLVPEAATAIEKMIADAEMDGMCLVVLSSHRTFGRQQYLYDTMKDKTRVARPGTSEHEFGAAVDLQACATANGFRDDTAARPEIDGDFDKLPEYGWLKANASTYGFTESYREDNQSETGFIPEPWHWKHGDTSR